MKRLKVSGMTGECDLLIGESLRNIENYVKSDKRIIITDSHVRGFHENSFPKGEIIEIGIGESSKTLETIQKI